MAILNQQIRVSSTLILLSLLPLFSLAQTLWGISADDSGYIYNFNIQKNQFNLVHSFIGSDHSIYKRMIGTDRIVGDQLNRAKGTKSSTDTIISPGYQPQGMLLKGNNNYIYGITTLGGKYQTGVLFRIDTLSLGYEEILNFDASFTVTGNPVLVDSMIYISGNDALSSKGCIIEYHLLSGDTTKTLLDDYFWYMTGTSAGNNGTLILPFRQLLRYYPSDHSTTIICGTPSMSLYGMGVINELENGDFYQSYTYAGSSEAGQINKYSASTKQLTSVYSTRYTVSSDITKPINAFVEDDSGNPVGCTAWKNENPGRIYGFDMKEDITYPGYNYQNKKLVNIFRFNDTTGVSAGSDLAKSKHHTVYGTTISGGRYGKGTIYEMDINTHKFTRLYDFKDISGNFPLFGRLLITNDFATTYEPALPDSGFSLFPNPTTGKLTTNYLLIGNEQVDITIFDISGNAKLLSRTLTAENKVLDISKLSSGIYIARITGRNFEKSIKIIKH